MAQLRAGTTIGGYAAYHAGNLPLFATRWPTAAEAGALPITGGVLTGRTYIDTNDPDPLVLARDNQVGMGFQYGLTADKTRYLGVDLNGNLHYGADKNHTLNDRVYTEGYKPTLDSLSGTAANAAAVGGVAANLIPKNTLNRMFGVPGGSGLNGSSSVTGRIKVKLPVSWNKNMMTMRIRVFNYSDSSSHFDVSVSGYLYTDGSTWINTAASIVGAVPSKFANGLTVMFGHDGDTCCIYLGDDDTNWSYPQVHIMEYTNGFSNVNSALLNAHSISFGVLSTDNQSANALTKNAYPAFSIVNKPDLSVIGAFPAAGGTLTGPVNFASGQSANMLKDNGTTVFGYHSTYGYFVGGNGYALYAGKSGQHAGVMFNSAFHTLYHEGHKPTLAELGAAAASHTHSNYFPTTGGTVSGSITSNEGIKAIGGFSNGSSWQTIDFDTVSVAPGSFRYDHYAQNSSNRPGNEISNANGVLTFGLHSTNYRAQMAFNSAGEVSTRGSVNSTFSAWRRQIDSVNLLNYVDKKGGMAANIQTINVGGDANTYYPVLIAINTNRHFGDYRFMVSRAFNDTAPNTWYTSTHKGGLTLSMRWTGDGAWGGNSHWVFVDHFHENYSTMVADIGLKKKGIVVWLRGGGAVYRVSSDSYDISVTPHLSGFTDSDGAVIGTMTTTPKSGLYSCYTNRGSSGLYDNNQRVFSPVNKPTWSHISGGSTSLIAGAGSSVSYGALDISGSKGNYSGIHFSAVGRTLMIHGSVQGIHTGSSWQWYFDNGVLTAGTVPWARISGIPAYASRWPTAAEAGAMADGGTYNTINMNNWYRSNSNTGWYNTTHNGGIYMIDSTWVRVYNGKAFYVPNQIAATSNVTAYYSDERLKDIIEDIDPEEALKSVVSWRKVRYTANELASQLAGYDTSKKEIGLLAGEIQKTYPELTPLAPFDYETHEDGTITSKSGEDYKTLDYERVVAVQAAAITQLHIEIEELKSCLNYLKKQFEKER